MWKDFQGKENSEEAHDDTQRWRIDDRCEPDRFWKKNLFKRLQAGSIEKSSRDWNTSHCKTGEYFKYKTYKHQFCWVIQVVLL